MHSSRYRSNKNPFEFFCHGILSFFTNNKPHGESKLTGYSLIKVRSLRNKRLCFTLQIIIYFFQSIQNLWYSKQPVPALQDISTPGCIFILLENKSFLQNRHTAAFRSRYITSLSHFALFYNKRSQPVNIYRLKWWHYCKLAVIWNVPLCPNTEHAFVNFATVMIFIFL